MTCHVWKSSYIHHIDIRMGARSEMSDCMHFYPVYAHSLCFPRTFKLVIIITRRPLDWGRNIWYLTLSHCDRLELLWENSKICYIATQKSSITFLSIVMLSIPNTPFSTHYPCLPMQIQAIHTEPRAGQRRTCLLQQQCTVLEGWLCSGQPPYFVSSPS